MLVSAVVCSMVWLRRDLMSGSVSSEAASWEPLAMCDGAGRCGEKPDVASRRSAYSLRSREQEKEWYHRHETNLVKKASFKPSSSPLIFLGNSIFESFDGTSLDMPVDRARGVPGVLELYRTMFSDILVLANSGDQTQHLLWRLETELPLVENATFLILIGTNNLGAGFSAPETAKGILAVVDSVLAKSRGGRVFLLSLLPRGDKPKPMLCPPSCDTHHEPLNSFLPAIRDVNAALREASLSTRKVHLIDETICGDPLFLRQDTQIRLDLMPDLLHPNAEGHARLARCLLSQFSSSSSSSSSTTTTPERRRR